MTLSTGQAMAASRWPLKEGETNRKLRSWITPKAILRCSGSDDQSANVVEKAGNWC